MALLRTMVDTGKGERPDSESAGTERIEVRSWPELNLDKWHRWGFNVTEVLRTPRYNFITQPVRASFDETGGPSPSFVLKGVWYRLNSDLERQIAKLIFPLSMTMMLLVVLLLLSVWSQQKYAAVVAFAALYLIAEGFLPLALYMYARDRKSARVEIPWMSLNKVILFPAKSILLLAWSAESNYAVAVQFPPGKAKGIYDNLKGWQHFNAEASIEEKQSVFDPPKSG